MKMSKNIPYILIAVAIFLIIFEASKNSFELNNESWKGQILSVLLLIVGIGLLFKIKNKS